MSVLVLTQIAADELVRRLGGWEGGGAAGRSAHWPTLVSETPCRVRRCPVALLLLGGSAPSLKSPAAN